MKVTIVGGGVAGLAIGWRLAETGFDIDILERGICGRAATWAAAGMLAASAEAGASEEPHAVLARAARAGWPDFARALQRTSGIALDFKRCGSLMVAEDEDQARRLSDVGAALRATGEKAEWLSPEEARRREPLLGLQSRGALFSADDARVDNRALGLALALAVARAGGRLRECCMVTALHVESGRARGVVTAEGVVETDCVIVTAGAWMNLLGGAADALPPVRPAKGQMVALTPPLGAAMPRCPIWGHGIYMVPGRDRLLIGATVEEAGYDTSVTRAARDALMAGAARLVPELMQWAVSESWAGLRPRTPDDAPVLGRTPIEGLFVAGGQFRNGILFAPAMADIMRDLLLGRPASLPTQGFDPRRFEQAA